MPAEYSKTVWSVISFAPFLSEVEKQVEEWLLVSLIYSLSLFYLVQMKMQLLFFSSQENFLKKEAISAKYFRSGFREKNALGN